MADEPMGDPQGQASPNPSVPDASAADPSSDRDQARNQVRNQARSEPLSAEPEAGRGSRVPETVTKFNTEFNIGEEFGTARRTLPPAGIVVICIAAVAVIVGIFAFKERAKPQGAGAINFVAEAEVPQQNIILVAITLTLRNTAERPLWIHTLKAQLTTANGETHEDEAVSVVDLDRYIHAFPTLKESAEPALSPETKMLPGSEQRGTIIVSFKVTKEAFDQRKSLRVSIQPYDQPLPVVLK
jgi:hypothetical protein